MAHIRSLTRSTSDSRVHPTEVDCQWQVVRDGSGGSLLTISTYGSDDRASEPKVSQTIQLDRRTAVQLHRILSETFNL